MSSEGNGGHRCLFCHKGTYRDMGITDDIDLNITGLGMRLVRMCHCSAGAVERCVQGPPCNSLRPAGPRPSGRVAGRDAAHFGHP